MKIIRISELCPTHLIEPNLAAFTQELEKLSNKYGIAVATTGGFVMFDPERDRVDYEQNPCTGDLEPIIVEK